MKYRRFIAAGLTCAVLLSLPVSVLAVRKGSGGPKAAGTLSAEQITPVYSTSLSFEQIENRVLRNNLSLHAARESLESARSNDISKQIQDAYDEINDGLDSLDDAISQMESSIASLRAFPTDSLDSAAQGLQTALSANEDGGFNIPLLANSIASISTASAMSAFGQMQAASMESNLSSLKNQRETLEEQLDELKENEKKMMDNFKKSIQDAEKQIENAESVTVAGAESLYLTILSTQLQYETLRNSLAATAKTVEEMELRHQLGQISAQTLLQVQNGYHTLESTLSGLETTLGTLRASLQSLLGEVPDGNLVLKDTPKVTQEELALILYDSDLARAKEKSYSLYSADRAVEKAEEDKDDARKDHGSSSYQYRMAEHAYQSALYQQASAVASFELSFLSLYQAIAPAQSALAVKEADLTYQEQVFAAAELKYQQGNISANALQDARDTLESARRDVEKAGLDLFTAYHSYRLAVNKGLVSSGS